MIILSVRFTIFQTKNPCYKLYGCNIKLNVSMCYWNMQKKNYALELDIAFQKAIMFMHPQFDMQSNNLHRAVSE